MTVTISQIEEKDIEGFNAALGVVARERRYITFIDAPPLESTRSFVLDNIKNDYTQLVARDDGKIVGWCDITPSKRHAIAHIGTLGIGLLPEYRNRGLGRKLALAAIERAQAAGLTRIELGVVAHNENAIALYKKLGFEMEGTRKKAHRMDGVYHDVHMMALLA